ncbi:MAG: MFS transporter [Alphaproteobacteria bacterium]
MTSGVAASRSERLWIVGLVGVGHFFSHFVMLALPPLFPLLVPELGIGYAAAGLLIGAFSLTTGAAQIPMGFLVDRIGGRAVLVLGLAVMGGALALVPFTEGYWSLCALLVIAGIGNSVFHPADYAILAARVGEAHFGRAVSIHTFLGYLGWAAAPPIMLALTAWVDWRMALGLVGMAGLAIAAVMLWRAGLLDDTASRAARGTQAREGGGLATGLALMRSTPMVMMFLFFVLTGMGGQGILAFTIVGLPLIHGVAGQTASSILTAHLVASAVGVLVGGWLADRTSRHNLVAALSIGGVALAILLVGFDEVPVLLMTLMMVLGGLLYGISSPSRDIIVKQAATATSTGVAFGFTATGLSIGSAIGPVVFGWIMDFGRPDLVFVGVAALMALSVVTVVLTRR